MEAKRKIKPQNPRGSREKRQRSPPHGASPGLWERADRGPRGPQSPGAPGLSLPSPCRSPPTAVFGGSPAPGATAGWDARPGDRHAGDFVETVFTFRCRSKAKRANAEGQQPCHSEKRQGLLPRLQEWHRETPIPQVNIYTQCIIFSTCPHSRTDSQGALRAINLETLPRFWKTGLFYKTNFGILARD